MHWQYRTILFEFRKDGLLGDRYIDDEEVEAVLNEQGARGWELVNVTKIQEGLLAFCKRKAGGEPVLDMQQINGLSHKADPESEIPNTISAETLQQKERENIRQLESRRRETMSALEKDVVGEIKIS